LTGSGQVHTDLAAGVEDAYRKLEYDLFYLKNMSVLFDFAIIFQTTRIVFGGKNGR
jgi:lipopolysaccharide/colanic/teichoic acid biosynthesis glycosyltransferase